MFPKVEFINEEIMVLVQFPKLAVNYIEMLVRKIVCDGIHVSLFL